MSLDGPWTVADTSWWGEAWVLTENTVSVDTTSHLYVAHSHCM